jgi:hypothetical protein
MFSVPGRNHVVQSVLGFAGDRKGYSVDTAARHPGSFRRRGRGGPLQSDRCEGEHASMRHYYSPLYREVDDPVESQSQPAAPTPVRPERVPALIDALDCLLALWVAEATLDAGPRHAERRPSGSGSHPGFYSR